MPEVCSGVTPPPPPPPPGGGGGGGGGAERARTRTEAKNTGGGRAAKALIKRHYTTQKSRHDEDKEPRLATPASMRRTRHAATHDHDQQTSTLRPLHIPNVDYD